MDFNKLESVRLLYKPFTENDFDDLFEILGDETVCKYLPGSNTYSKEQVKKWIQFFIKSFSIDKMNLVYAIRLKEGSKVIGYCGCNYVKEFEKDEIKYIFNSRYFGKGYASEAAFKMKEVAIELGLKELVGLADISNIPSQKILEKIGYNYKSTIKLWGSTLKYYEIVL